jgi:probable DNA metabolism protein
MLQRSLTFAEWRDRARPLLAARVAPSVAIDALVGDPASPSAPTPALTLPSTLMRLLESISCYRSEGRYELMYRLAFRTLFENPQLLEDAADHDVRSATLMDAAIRRDVHKMHAFVRFREIENDAGAPTYFAWFEPEHDILRRGSLFFAQRFPNMRWTIATPEGAAVWNLETLQFVESTTASGRPAGDDYESLWRTYYRNICNVARINPSAMQREMPKKYWKNLPEAAEIGALIRSGLSHGTANAKRSEERVNMTKAVERALGRIPKSDSGPAGCQRCDLWRQATQAVLGEGPPTARIMLVGEQPGDEEDLRGHPFVGPAGRVLDQAIAAAGLTRSALYITNAVKHFKWEPRGKRRLHKKPDVREINACHLWLDQEITDIHATVIVALGATALRSLLGKALSIESAREQTLAHECGASILATYHPSAILRAEDRAESLRAALVADLVRARELAS